MAETEIRKCNQCHAEWEIGEKSKFQEQTHGCRGCPHCGSLDFIATMMTETTIDEILSLLRDQKTDLEESVAFIKNSMGELRQKQNYASGRLREIDYLIKYIEGDDHD